jgi:hypothetical protein
VILKWQAKIQYNTKILTNLNICLSYFNFWILVCDCKISADVLSNLTEGFLGSTAALQLYHMENPPLPGLNIFQCFKMYHLMTTIVSDMVAFQYL